MYSRSWSRAQAHPFHSRSWWAATANPLRGYPESCHPKGLPKSFLSRSLRAAAKGRPAKLNHSVVS